MDIKQSTVHHLPVWMPSVDDGRVGATELTLAISASKAGGAFSDITAECTVVERGNGWYDVTHTAAHVDTLGVFARRITATGADDVNETFNVVEVIASDIQGIVSQGVPHFYYPTSIVRTIGSDEGGDVGDLAAHDETMFATGEVVGQGIDVVATFATSLTNHIPSQLRIPAYYNGGASHSVIVSVWNYTLSAWEQKLTMLSRTSAFDYEAGLTSDHHDSGTGEMKVRFQHAVVATYIATHRLYIDMLEISKVEATSTLASDVAIIREHTDPLTYTGQNVNATLRAGLTGIQTVTLQFYRTATTTPIPDVVVDVYDSTETTRLNGTQLRSDVNGQATFGRDNGTYKVRAMLAGFTFTTGEVVVSGADVTLIMYGDAVAADPPIAVDAIRVYEFCFMPDGATPMPVASVKAKAHIINLPYDYNGRYHSGQLIDGVYNVSNGKVYWDLAPGATTVFDIRNVTGGEKTKTVPLTAVDNTIRLKEIV